MKFILILAAILVAPALARTQCTALELIDLQTLQRAEPYQKESKINDLGFDLRSEFTQGGKKNRGYTKCWNSTVQSKAVYEQLIWWNTDLNKLTFFTLNEEHFRSLRQSIVERQASGRVTENPDVYVGHQFIYHFGTQRVDGVEYFFISIAFKG